MSLTVQIKKRFGSFTLDVAFEANNEILGFLGASGCGKSLTLRCIAGVEEPDEGLITVNGTTFFKRDAGSKHPEVNLTPQERKSALLFQNYQLFPNLTVTENVGAGITRSMPRAKREALIAEELTRFGLTGFERRYPSQLSGGQQQRVALARMLAARPGILMLDEPFSALDSHLKGILEQNLAALFESYEGTILYVSHDIDEALRFCDRIVVVDSGHIIEMSTGESLVNHPRSLASIKLSGCRNATPAVVRTPHILFLPSWGIEVQTDQAIPEHTTFFGVRAFYLERANGPGRNCYRMRVERISDARFDRTATLTFLDRSEDADPEVSRNGNEMTYLKQHLTWRIDKLQTARADLPEAGDEVWIHIPEDRIYLVNQ